MTRCFFSCNYHPSCPVNSEDPIPCSNGSFAPAGSTYCHSCPIGSQCPSEKLSFHLPCANGSFSVVENATICTECPSGSKCPNPAVGPVECENGTYSKAGATHCIECPSGYRWGVILLVFGLRRIWASRWYSETPSNISLITCKM